MYESKTTKPPGQLTGVSVKKCYASCLGDCDGSIEKEHPLPKCALLELFGTKPIEVTGWVDNKTLLLTAEGCSSNVLCARHNRALSGIDGSLKRWTLATKLMHGDVESSMGFININARELALILLQISCGLIAVNKKEVPKRWVEILFSMTDYDLQLYQIGNVGDTIYNEKRFNHTVLEIDNKPVGCVLKSKGFALATFIDCEPSKGFFPAKRMKSIRKDNSEFVVRFK